jgi:glycosyltransferase involved in cell wall biosynthesis
MPTVSVIVPNYNHAPFLRQRIESILRQTYQDFELILLDDCSTDDSRAVLSQCASDPRVRLEFNEVNSGSTFKQWNKGARLARGKYIWMAESDDYADEKFLECLVAALERDEKIAFAYCRSWRVMENGRTNGFIDPFYTLDPLWNSDFCVDGREHCRKFSVRSPVICNASAALFQKSAYEMAGGADESLRLCGDWKMWAAMALVGKVAYVNQPLNYFRHHPSTVRIRTARDATDVMEKLRVIRWILDKSDPSPSDIRLARQAAAHQWVPAVMSLRIPWRTKLAILKSARKIDPYPSRRLLRPAASTIRLKFLRHWHSRRPAVERPA